ncbi:MAG: SHOCT domain-containing protein [Oscillochloris sp.]|nr:SHOCT domain-containing protein [Oscillochloris sp.]
MEVQRPGHPPYQASTRMLIKRKSSLFAPSNVYPPGTRLDVRVDRNRPERVAIVGPIGGATTANAQVFMVDGQVYDRGADLPPEAQQVFAQAAELFGEGLAAAGSGAAARLAELKKMRDQGLITETEYEAKKAEILERL